ncbi:hypothetical protein [Pannonibacter sp.]|uniref:hypothetical protein n=1 Tax=Pannonibacter sp. TaxID=1906786 RepID=UPI003F70C597
MTPLAARAREFLRLFMSLIVLGFLSAQPIAALEFKPLGGVSTSRTAVVVWGSGSTQRVAIFIRGQDNALWWQAGNGMGEWYGWARIGGSLKGAPACANNGLGSVVCAVRWSDDSVQYTSYDIKSGKWTGFTSTGGKVLSDPDVIRLDLFGQQALFIYAIGRDNRLWQWRSDGTWQITTQDRFYNTAPSCSDMNVSPVPCLMRNRDTKGFEFYENASAAAIGAAPQIETLKLPLLDRPEVFRASPVQGDYYVFFRNSANEITATRRTAPGNWQVLKQLPGKIAYDPGCARFPTGRIWCAIVNQVGAVTALGIDSADLK